MPVELASVEQRQAAAAPQLPPQQPVRSAQAVHVEQVATDEGVDGGRPELVGVHERHGATADAIGAATPSGRATRVSSDPARRQRTQWLLCPTAPASRCSDQPSARRSRSQVCRPSTPSRCAASPSAVLTRNRRPAAVLIPVGPTCTPAACRALPQPLAAHSSRLGQRLQARAAGVRRAQVAGQVRGCQVGEPLLLRLLLGGPAGGELLDTSARPFQRVGSRAAADCGGPPAKLSGVGQLLARGEPLADLAAVGVLHALPLPQPLRQPGRGQRPGSAQPDQLPVAVRGVPVHPDVRAEQREPSAAQVTAHLAGVTVPDQLAQRRVQSGPVRRHLQVAVPTVPGRCERCGDGRQRHRDGRARSSHPATYCQLFALAYMSGVGESGWDRES